MGNYNKTIRSSIDMKGNRRMRYLRRGDEPVVRASFILAQSRIRRSRISSSSSPPAFLNAQLIFENGEVMRPEEGPYLQVACFCETALHESSGVFSLIRIIDTVEMKAAGPEAPDEMPPTTIQLKLVLMVKSGRARGRFDVGLEPELPSGLRQDMLRQSIHLEGDARGHTHVTNLSYLVTQEGTYWFRVYLDDEFMTAIPLRVKYSRTTSA